MILILLSLIWELVLMWNRLDQSMKDELQQLISVVIWPDVLLPDDAVDSLI